MQATYYCPRFILLCFGWLLILSVQPVYGSDAEGQSVQVRTPFAMIDLKKYTIGLSGNLSTQPGERSHELGPKVGMNWIQYTTPSTLSEVSVEAKLSYKNALTKLGDESTRRQTTELNYAKIAITKWKGKKRRLVPYASSGFQYVDSRKETPAGMDHKFFWAPTAGVGIDYELNSSASLGIEYTQNFKGDGKKISTYTLGLDFDVAALLRALQAQKGPAASSE